jgi:phosphoribosylformylglycinamidine synthase
MAEASEALGVPVVSGNVSLYNESHGHGVYPTPVVGALGLLEEVSERAGIGFAGSGHAVVLLGASELRGDVADLAGSEYLELLHGLVAGRPAMDLRLEAAVQRACRRLVQEKVLSSAHDCSDGGLAVALAESCIAGGVGFVGDFTIEGRWDAALFGEAQSRIVVSLNETKLAHFSRVCLEENVPWMALGRTGGQRLRIAGVIDLPLDEVDDAWRRALQRSLASPSPPSA